MANADIIILQDLPKAGSPEWFALQKELACV